MTEQGRERRKIDFILGGTGEVSSQAVRSAKWKWKFKDLCKHILVRERSLAKPHRPTRFLSGSPADVNRFVKLSRIKEIRPEIVIIQPGLQKSELSDEQRAVLAAADSFLKNTVEVDPHSNKK